MGLLARFSPDECFAGLAEIDLAGLKSRGFDAILLDLDNTLLPWKNSELPSSSRDWVNSAKVMGLKPCILSNTHYPVRLHNIAAQLEVPSFERALKPRRGGFLRASEHLGAAPAHCVVVGDQILTDILGGNLAGMHTILVKPMDRREFIGTKLSRLIERVILALLRRQARSGTNSRPEQSQTKDSRLS